MGKKYGAWEISSTRRILDCQAVLGPVEAARHSFVVAFFPFLYVSLAALSCPT